MTKNIPVTTPISGQRVVGYITKTHTELHDCIVYGVFATTNEALDWADNLMNATVEPIYEPAFNRG